MSISPTSYAQLFCKKVSYEAFLYLHFRFELFWRKKKYSNSLDSVVGELSDLSGDERGHRTRSTIAVTLWSVVFGVAKTTEDLESMKSTMRKSLTVFYAFFLFYKTL